MAPPLPSPITIRLPEELTAWIDDQILHGIYKDRSSAIREIVDAVSQVAPESSGERPTPGQPLAWAPGAYPPPSSFPSAGPPQVVPGASVNVPWFILPMLPRPPYSRDEALQDVHRLPFDACIDFVVDPMFAPEMYVPFGVWSDDRDRAKFQVEEIKVGGGADLLGQRPTPLTLAGETAWRNGFPSRLTIDPFYLEERSSSMGGSLPICKHPNITTVTLRRLGEPAVAASRRDLSFLDKRVMTWSAPAAEDLSNQSAHGAVTLLSIREILAGAGLDLEGLRRVLGDPFGSRRTDAFRMGILAVAVEHRDRVVARLTDQPFEVRSTP